MQSEAICNPAKVSLDFSVNENQDPDQPQVQQQGQQTELWSGSESGAREIPVSSAQVLGNDPSMAALIGQFSPNLVKQILELLCDESVRA